MARHRKPDSTSKRADVPSPQQVPMSARRQMYELFRAHTEEMRDVLLGIARDKLAEPAPRVQAAKEILNRGWGQAPNIEIIEAAFKHEHTLNLDALKQLPARQLAELELLLASMVQVKDADVIEGTPVQRQS